MNWLNYHHLHYFWIIATEGSIARASEKLKLGQPALSAQLKQLEESIGVPLFDRRNRKLVLTDAGKVALQYASEIFRLGAEMVEALHDRLPLSSKVHVQIGALDSVPKDIALRLTEQALATANCSVSILEGKGDELFRELLAHRLDLILSNYPPPAVEGVRVYARSVAKLPVAIYSAPKFAGLKKGFPKSLDGQRFVLPTPHSKLRHDFEHYFKVNGLTFEPVAETQDSTLQKIMGASGLGLIPIAEAAAEDLTRDKKLVKLGRLESVFDEIWLIAASRRVENPVAAELLKSFAL